MCTSVFPFARLTLATVVAGAMLIGPAAASAQTTVSAVQWTGLVHSAPTGSALSKVSGCNGCPDAGASSVQELPATGGYLEFAPVLGARLIAGLGAAGAGSTDAVHIQYSFGFWPDGGWDIRERGAYRAEGRYSAGDTFRIAMDGQIVRYYRNGGLVYTSAAAPALPLQTVVTLHTIGASIGSASITAPEPSAPPAPSSPPPSPQQPPAPSEPGPSEPPPSTSDPLQPAPSTYNAITDRQPRPKPPVPELGAAGHQFSDPVFGTRLMRVTDRATRPAALDRSYRTPSATHSNAWSADNRFFYTVSTDGTTLPYAFDPKTMKATRLEPSSSGDGGRTFRFFAEPSFSYVTPGLLFGTFNGAGSNLRSVDEYDMYTQQYRQLLNLDTLVAGLSGTYIGGLLNSGGPVERLVAFFGGTSQDRHMYLVVFDRGNPSNRRVVDTLASTVDGAPANIVLNFLIHATAIDRSGRYVTIYPTGKDLQAPRSAAPAYVWDLVTNTFTATPLIAARAGGHDAYGYGVRVNQDCCTSTSWDAAQWQYRALNAPLATADLITPVLTPKSVYLADHPSWHNAVPDRLVPFLNATYRYDINTTAWRAWDNEIIAVQTDKPGTGATVWRFAHHRSDVASDNDPTRLSFWYTPRVNVSPDGRWALFTSNWEKTLGYDPRGEVGGAARQDLFLVELRQQNVSVPVTVTTASLPAGTVEQAYGAALSASGGSGTYTWALAGGALPPGIALNATTGSLSGTPTSAGTYGVTFRAMDVQDSTAYGDAALALTIQAAPAPPPPPSTIAPLSIITTALPDPLRDVHYQVTLVANGGTAPYTWRLVSGALPKGFVLDAATGVIRGTTLDQGMFKITVEVRDASNPALTSTRAFSFRVTRK